MPCDTYRRPEQTLEERNAEVTAALKRLEQSIKGGAVRLGIGPNGAIVFGGWKPEQRAGVSDVCAYRVLQLQGSWELRQAVARAEAQTGRKVNSRAVAAGVHSHDGGSTWSKH